MKYQVLIIVVMIFTSCSYDSGPITEENIQENEQSNESTVEMTDEALYGDWRWILSTGGIVGDELTPASTGMEQCVNITESDISFIRDGDVDNSYNYILEKDKSIFSQDSTILLKIENVMHYNYEFDGIVLKLKEEIYDGYIHSYERK